MRSTRCRRRSGSWPLVVLLSAILFGPAAVAQKVGYDQFVKTLNQSIDLGDQRGLDKAIQDNIVHSLAHYRGLVLEDLRAGNSARLPQRQAMQAAWKRVFDGDTLERFDRWLQSVEPDTLRSYDKIQDALRQAYAEFARLKQGAVRERGPWQALITSTMKIAEAFREIGAPLDAADAWGLVAQQYYAVPDKTLDDRKEAMFAIDQFFSFRQQWSFVKDQSYLMNWNWAKAEKEAIAAEAAADAKRAAEGYADGTKGVEGWLVPDADASELVGDLGFEVMKKPKAEDMSLWAGPVPAQWGSVYVEKTGPQPLPWFKAAELYMVRPGASDFGITISPEADVEKNPFTEVEAANKVRDATAFALDANGERRYAMWFYLGGDQERFQGYNQNLAPQQELARVFFKSAASWKTTVGEHEVTFFDDNTNGLLFEEDPMAFGMKVRHLGESFDTEVPVPAFDSMQIGKEAPVPLSSWVKLGADWYHVRGKEDGRKVGFRKANPEYFKTGKLTLDWNGPRGAKLTMLIVRARGDFTGAAFDLADGKPHEVPAGVYELALGRLESGRGARLMTAHVFGGDSVQVTVPAGGEATLTLGAPFRLDFRKQASGTKVSIHAATIRVRGSAGETYAYLNGAVVEPVVVVSRSEDGKGAREVGEFRAIDNPDLALAASQKVPLLGGDIAYYPLPKGSQGEVELVVDVPAGQFVGLQQAKHKLFGDLQPIWK